MILVTENFKYPSGQSAVGETVVVKNRDLNTIPPTYDDAAGLVPSGPLVTDSVGNLSFYIAPGSYDFEVRGVRVPFDVEAPSSGTAAYTHTQTILNDTWTIIHNLGFKPQVAVVIGGEEVLADVSWPDLNTVIVGLDIPRMGYAYLS